MMLRRLVNCSYIFAITIIAIITRKCIGSSVSQLRFSSISVLPAYVSPRTIEFRNKLSMANKYLMKQNPIHCTNNNNNKSRYCRLNSLLFSSQDPDPTLSQLEEEEKKNKFLDKNEDVKKSSIIYNFSSDLFRKLRHRESSNKTTLDYLLTGINLVQANFEKTTFTSKQRVESIKASLVSAVAGGFGFAPVGYLFYSDNLPQWEFSTDMASVESFLFGLVYRYATRDDENEHLKTGVIAAFTITRALSMVQVTDTCLAIPLRCGDLPFPLGYFDSNMLIMFAIGLATSFATFFAASTALEFCFDNEYIERVES